MHPFRSAVEGHDIDGMIDLLAQDVVFNSPVVFHPYHGRETVSVLLRAVMGVFEDFRYESETASEDGHDHALVFRARIGDRELEGCDFLHSDDDGLIDRFTVMVRPLSGTLALAEAMKAAIPVIEAELGIAQPG